MFGFLMISQIEHLIKLYPFMLNLLRLLNRNICFQEFYAE